MEAVQAEDVKRGYPELMPVSHMSDRAIAEETLIRLRSYEQTTRDVIEAGKKNPMLAQMLRAYGIPV